MGLALFTLFVAIAFVIVAGGIFVVGIVLVVTGSKNKKKGGKGTARKVGILLLSLPALCGVLMFGYSIWYKFNDKCKADEWRYSKGIVDTRADSQKVVKELLGFVDDDDKELFSREFSANVRDDRHFEDTVDDFFDDLDIDIDDDLLYEHWSGEQVYQDYDGEKSHYYFIYGYLYTEEIDGETYYFYIRFCTRDDFDRDNVGVQQFIVCTEDKYDELNEIIEDADDDLYLAIL